jgi:Protein of unknown function (DUF2924)
MSNNTTLARLAHLRKATIPELIKSWEELFGTRPPSCNRPFLESRLAYRIQELSHGGLSDDSKRRIKKLREDIYEKKRNPNLARLTPGTVLVREWGDAQHRIRVLVDGFEYAGKPYRSLSAVARAITGTNWNGPMFFGLRNNEKRAS